MNPNDLPRIDFDMKELRALVAILDANIRHSRRLMATFSRKKQAVEKKRIPLLINVKTALKQQIEKGEVGLVLTREELRAVIKALKVYRGYIIEHVSRDENRDTVLIISYSWLERFNGILAQIHP